MAKLRSSFGGNSNKRTPSFTSDVSSPETSIKAPRVAGLGLLNAAASGSVSQSLRFGAFHSKTTSTSSSGLQWKGLLNAATGGGATSVFGGGSLFSSGALGLIGGLFSLFESKSTSPAPVAFQTPVPKQDSLNIAPARASSPVNIGVHPLTTNGIYQTAQPAGLAGQAHSTDVVQIVKQALLTSSSLNDVISEI